MKIMKYIMLFILTILTSFITTPNSNFTENVKIGYRENSMIWVGEWQSSDDLSSAYGKGRFFYRFARSKYPVDRYGNYKHEISFISDSFYPHYMYSDQNGDGILDADRCSTKIDNMTLYVNGDKYINNLTSTTDFWILFRGDFRSGYGEVRVQLLHPNINPSITIRWTTPKPF